MYDAKEFGKIQLRPWMLFMDKAHLKSVVRDYCIQEGFAIVVDAAHNIRYRCSCSSEVCKWRVCKVRMASRDERARL